MCCLLTLRLVCRIYQKGCRLGHNGGEEEEQKQDTFILTNNNKYIQKKELQKTDTAKEIENYKNKIIQIQQKKQERMRPFGKSKPLSL